MPSQKQTMSALESLRTVEFRQTLRGYHIDDVDEYLERVALEAEALQEQMHQSAERMRQATDRIAQLEQAQRQAPAQASPSAPAPPRAAEVADPDETLKRTLLLAQKFVEQTEADAQAQAQAVVAEAEQRARAMVAEAEGRANTAAQDSERRLREEVSRLEGLRTKLAADVEAISARLESERSRLRGALGEMVRWIDDNLAPSAALKVPAEGPGEARPLEDMGAGSSGAGALPGLQTLSRANTPNGAPR